MTFSVRKLLNDPYARENRTVFMKQKLGFWDTLYCYTIILYTILQPLVYEPSLSCAFS